VIPDVLQHVPDRVDRAAVQAPVRFEQPVNRLFDARRRSQRITAVPTGVPLATAVAAPGVSGRARRMSVRPDHRLAQQLPASSGNIACASCDSAAGSMPAPRQNACVEDRRSFQVVAC
jgi:hypothetical protein